ncbi:MAG: hypothetical protein WKF58_02445 [Ilumatobacteraceae bacterium]
MNGLVAWTNTSTSGVMPRSRKCGERMEQGALGRRRVAGQLGGPLDDLGTGRPGGAGDGVIVGRHDDEIDGRAGHAGVHRTSDERTSADLAEVLVRDALRSASRGDHGDHGVRHVAKW